MVDKYDTVGVDYEILDGSKRAALTAAAATSALIEQHDGRVLEDSRGASAFVLELGGQQLAFVVEGLGTKSILARNWLEASGEDRFADIGIDAVGAIVNDICSVGALPVVVNAYFATGRSGWHENGTALDSLLRGWRDGCEQAGAVWGGGESPALPGLLSDTDVEVAGAAIGSMPTGWDAVLGEDLRAGDAIVLSRALVSTPMAPRWRVRWRSRFPLAFSPRCPAASDSATLCSALASSTRHYWPS
jgi:phosphoribosylformylglycinamidine cyclo-ligase